MRQIQIHTPRGIRNRLGDINSLYADNKIAADEAERLARVMVARWQKVEPLTEFTVRWTDDAEDLDLITKILDKISDELGLLVNTAAYLRRYHEEDIQLLNGWLTVLTAHELGRIIDGGDEELYESAPRDQNGQSVARIIEKFTT